MTRTRPVRKLVAFLGGAAFSIRRCPARSNYRPPPDPPSLAAVNLPLRPVVGVDHHANYSGDRRRCRSSTTAATTSSSSSSSRDDDGGGSGGGTSVGVEMPTDVIPGEGGGGGRTEAGSARRRRRRASRDGNVTARACRSTPACTSSRRKTSAREG